MRGKLIEFVVASLLFGLPIAALSNNILFNSLGLAEREFPWQTALLIRAGMGLGVTALADAFPLLILAVSRIDFNIRFQCRAADDAEPQWHGLGKYKKLQIVESGSSRPITIPFKQEADENKRNHRPYQFRVEVSTTVPTGPRAFLVRGLFSDVVVFATIRGYPDLRLRFSNDSPHFQSNDRSSKFVLPPRLPWETSEHSKSALLTVSRAREERDEVAFEPQLRFASRHVFELSRSIAEPAREALRLLRSVDERLERLERERVPGADAARPPAVDAPELYVYERVGLLRRLALRAFVSFKPDRLTFSIDTVRGDSP